jgi:tetratricopeptide (TPR) repeat protein
MSTPSEYKLLVEIGRGDYTVVSAAARPQLGQPVAIKQLTLSARQDPRHANRLRDTLRLLAAVTDYTHVLRPLDFVLDSGWLVLELMNGSLADRLRQETGAIPPSEVRGILRDALRGLQAIHAAGRCHGHLKPSNLLFDGDGRIKVADTAGLFTGGTAQPPRGVLESKYAAPERFDAAFGKIGPASDLYALGFLALELLCGQRFEVLFHPVVDAAPNPAAGWQAWHAAPDARLPAGLELSNVPADLARVIGRLLRKPVVERCSGVEQVLKDLEAEPDSFVVTALALDEPAPPALISPAADDEPETMLSVVDAISVDPPAPQPSADMEDYMATAYPELENPEAKLEASDEGRVTWVGPPVPAIEAGTPSTVPPEHQVPDEVDRTWLSDASPGHVEESTRPPDQAADEWDDVIATADAPASEASDEEVPTRTPDEEPDDEAPTRTPPEDVEDIVSTLNNPAAARAEPPPLPPVAPPDHFATADPDLLRPAVPDTQRPALARSSRTRAIDPSTAVIPSATEPLPIDATSTPQAVAAALPPTDPEITSSTLDSAEKAVIFSKAPFSKAPFLLFKPRARRRWPKVLVVVLVVVGAVAGAAAVRLTQGPSTQPNDPTNPGGDAARQKPSASETVRVAVQVNSEPTGAEFTVAGATYTTPKTVDLPPGNYTIIVRMEPYYQPGSDTFTVQPSDTTRSRLIRLKLDAPAVLNRLSANACLRIDEHRPDGNEEADCTRAINLLMEAAPPDELGIAYRSRGHVRAAKGDRHGAIADYSEAIRQRPKYGPFYAERGRIYLELDRPPLDNAIADFRRAIENNSALKPTDTPEMRLLLGRTLRRAGELQAAIPELEKAAKQFDNDWSLWAELADVRLELVDARLQPGEPEIEKANADYGKARSLLADAREKNLPAERRIYRCLGRCARLQGNGLRALDMVKESMDAGPEAATFNERGLIRYQRGEYESAIQDHTEAMRIRISTGITDETSMLELIRYLCDATQASKALGEPDKK